MSAPKEQDASRCPECGRGDGEPFCEHAWAKFHAKPKVEEQDGEQELLDRARTILAKIVFLHQEDHHKLSVVKRAEELLTDLQSRAKAAPKPGSPCRTP